MPQMTGLQLLLELERRGLSIPALLITGAHDPEVAREADRLGAMTVMQKPVAPQKLLQFVAFSAGLTGNAR
jgi:two-component system response regulator FixJ